MTSISAVEYACRQASEYAESAGVFYCSAPVTNGWEIATAIGTIGATLAAVIFGILSEFRSRSDRKRAENAERRLRLQGPGQKIIDSFERLANSGVLSQDTLPLGNVEILPYRELLNREGRIEQEFGSALGTLAISVIMKLENLLPRDEQGVRTGEPVPIGVVQSMILRQVSSTLRRGIADILYAESDSEKQVALKEFRISAEKAAKDMEGFEGWPV